MSGEQAMVPGPAIRARSEHTQTRARRTPIVSEGTGFLSAPAIDPSILESIGDLNPSRLAVLELVSTPLWLWDLSDSQIYWANFAALSLWDQPDIEQLNEQLGGIPRLNGQGLDDHPELGNARSSRCSVVDGLMSVRLGLETSAILCRSAAVTLEEGRAAVLIELLPDPLGHSGTDLPKWADELGAPDHPQVDLNNLVLQGQNEVLDLVGRGADLEATLECITVAVESLLPTASALIMLLDPGRQVLHCAAAPSLPTAVLQAIEGLRIDDSLGFFATLPTADGTEAAREGASGQNAPDLDEALRRHGLSSNWSRPLLNHDRKTLGTLSLFFKQDRQLSPEEEQAVIAMAGLARFAIETDLQKRQLVSANERFTSLAASIPGVVYQRVVRPDGDIRYTYISDGAKDMFGVSPTEIVEDPQALFNRHGPEYYATFRDRLLAASKALTMWDVEATIITRDGQRKFTHAIARPHKEPDDSVVWNGIILDQTRIKEAELEAAAAEARTRETIVESIPQGFILFDENDKWVTCNSHFLDFYPYLKAIATPDTSYEQIQKSIIENELDTGDNPGGGESKPVEKRVSEKLAQHALDHHNVEYRLADGRWILINEERTADGGTVILLIDVTELKLRESELERSNRELQDFASVASHDLQEPLRKIEAFGDRLSAKCGEQLSDDGKVYLERMQNAAGRMRSLINALLSYSRVTTKAKPFATVDLGSVLSDVLSDLQVAIEESEAEIDQGKLPTIDADPLQFQMLFQNIISNALKFRREGVAPKIEISARVFQNTGAEVEFGVPTGEVCEIVIADNGIGFEMKYLDRIFNIFQRLHGRNEYPGTGIGLATCRKIVERHHGVISADSEPGKGTKFLVTLPVRQANREQSA